MAKEIAREARKVVFCHFSRDENIQVIVLDANDKTETLRIQGVEWERGETFQTYKEADDALPKVPSGWDNQPDYPYRVLKGWAK